MNRQQIINKLQINGNWNIIKGKIKQQYAYLNDNDLTYVEGKGDELLGRIQKRTGETIEEILETINYYSNYEMDNLDR